MSLSKKSITIGILAGGISKRFGGKDKAFQLYQNIPFILHVIQRANQLEYPILIAVQNAIQKERLQTLIDYTMKFVVDTDFNKIRSPLVGMYSLAQRCTSTWLLMLPCDAILIHPEVFSYLISKINNQFDAFIPYWTNHWFEPLQAIYRTESLVSKIPSLLTHKPPLVRPKHLMDQLRVLPIPIAEFKPFDPNLDSFINVNTAQDLKDLSARQN